MEDFLVFVNLSAFRHSISGDMLKIHAQFVCLHNLMKNSRSILYNLTACNLIP